MIIKKIKNLAIKNAKFIIVPKIYHDELLSSWFVRTAYAHHTHPHTFLQLHLGENGHAISSDNFDINITDDEIKILENKSDKIGLYEMTLKSYSGFLQENIITNGTNILLCSQRFCPKCLRESVIYFRKHWRIVFNTVCIKHKCYLYDACPKCKCKIIISKIYGKNKSFKYCYNCGFDLSKSIVKPLQKLGLNIKYVDKINTILDDGYIQFKNFIVYSFVFFNVIIQISKKILRHKKYHGIEKIKLSKYLNVKQKMRSNISIFNQISIKEQFILFSIIMKLFENYPINFHSYISINKLTYWQMIRDMENVSFWYSNLLNTISPKEIYLSKMITKEEIKNAKEYLIKNNIEVNKSSMSRITGCNFHSSYNKLKI